MKKIFCFLIIALFFISFASAGIGIKSTQRTFIFDEGGRNCIESVSAYNPFDTATMATIGISEELQEVLVEQSAEERLIPAETSSDNSIPLKFCFEIPDSVYIKQELGVPILGNVVGGKIDCAGQPEKEYSGEVVIQSIPVAGAGDSGFGGSSTVMSVSTPVGIKVRCVSQGYDFTIVYIAVAILSAGVVAIILFRRYRKPKSERLREQMKKLRDEMKKSKR